MVYAEPKHQNMRDDAEEYRTNTVECRKALLAKSFEGHYESGNGLCCDICEAISCDELINQIRHCSTQQNIRDGL